MLSQDNVTLRTIEPTDVDFLYTLENEMENWQVSQTVTPFSKQTLTDYALSTHDITIQKQLRLVIEKSGEAVGAIDLFEYDAINQRAGVGLIVLAERRGEGIAIVALKLIEEYAFDILQLSQLWCNISGNNTISQNLFDGLGYIKCGTKVGWTRTPSGWEDEHIYQMRRK